MHRMHTKRVHVDLRVRSRVRMQDASACTATYASEEHGTAWQWPTGNLNRRWVVQWQH